MERQQDHKERSVAWFKLAELIARGEREKALSVFRLLAHSLPDRAYVLQIEGDILWFLDDVTAADKYKQAAVLYHKEKRLVDAISLYEHLLMQRADSYDILSHLLILYASMDWKDKFEHCFARMLALFSKHAIDTPQLEKTLRDLAASSASTNPWLASWAKSVTPRLPTDLQPRMADIFDRIGR